jgi:hypothetical protein
LRKHSKFTLAPSWRIGFIPGRAKKHEPCLYVRRPFAARCRRRRAWRISRRSSEFMRFIEAYAKAIRIAFSPQTTAHSRFRASHSALRRRYPSRASTEYRPCFHRARLLRARPSGVRGPVLLPPCSRQHRFPRIAGPRHGCPVRLLRAPHRRAIEKSPGGLPCFSQAAIPNKCPLWIPPPTRVGFVGSLAVQGVVPHQPNVGHYE